MLNLGIEKFGNFLWSYVGKAKTRNFTKLLQKFLGIVYRRSHNNFFLVNILNYFQSGVSGVKPQKYSDVV